ncbi:MAG: 50S ribosomal protein L4 [Candidatus Sumerlaeota bacterium]|nr:50S ribosomal protein L4 [Candidatus Sumerlaeota bacterium]
MATLTIVTSQGGPAGTMEVKDTLVACEVNLNAVRQCVNAFLAAQRQGTHMTKTKGLVRGGGIKPWKQKGTGRARAGSTRSPIWRHGGTIFGPQPRSYRKKVNAKVRRLAMRSVLTDRVQSSRLLVLESLAVGDGKVKTLEAMLKALNIVGKTLIVTEKPEEMVQRASRNRPGVDVQIAGGINAYEVLCHDNLIVTKDAIKKMEAMWG